MTRRDWKYIGIYALIILMVVASLAWTKFAWDECRKDPDHTFWHCVQVMD
jgi:hypothetical protein